MRRTAQFSPLLLWLASTALMQAADPLHFSAASVKPVLERPNGFRDDYGDRKPRVSLEYVELVQLIRYAYDLPDFQIERPDWTNDAHYNIQAAVPPETSVKDLRLMYQALLADRFGLKYHWQTKSLSGSELVRRGTLSLDAAMPAPDSRVGTYTYGFQNGASHYSFSSVTMSELAAFFGQLLIRPTVDATELAGSYQLKVDISVQEMNAPFRPLGGLDESAADPSPLLTDSLKKLGLSFKAAKIPVNVLVIDSISKPTPD